MQEECKPASPGEGNARRLPRFSNSITFTFVIERVVSALLNGEAPILARDYTPTRVPFLCSHRLPSCPVQNPVIVPTSVFIVHAGAQTLHGIAPRKVHHAGIGIAQKGLANLVQAMV